MGSQNQDKIQLLIGKGVRILDPGSVDIGEDINPDRISGDRVTIYPGCRIYGNDTLIMEGATLGFEGPATIVNCQLGPGVELRGGFFQQSVFLDRASVGSGAQIREGCIMEEESSCAHTVGLKQTILFPFVALGSLINFCDCLMSGGTGRGNHSEVGSSYIHFNFTPNQDKATPSLIGDVPRGVMLNQPTIFLGGQGGLVGPSRIGFGSVIAAGTIFRRDSLEGVKLLLGGVIHRKELPFHPGLYLNVKQKTLHNINYIANLIALRNWYRYLRSIFFSGDGLRKELLRAGIEILDRAVEERVHRLSAFAEKLPLSAEIYRKSMKGENTPEVLLRKEQLFEFRHRVGDLLLETRQREYGEESRDNFLRVVDRSRSGGRYIEVIRNLPPDCVEEGRRWLQGIVDEVTGEVLEIIPAFD
jgi:UDP-N-acetylglucosamine/UDP-N-acetylgalactosamine diphosphorylase